jgi:hypothetical protein
MTLRGRTGLWIVVIVALSLLLLFMPAATKMTLLDYFSSRLGDYESAVEQAQSDSENDGATDAVADAVDEMQVRIEGDISDYAGIELLNLTETDFFPEYKALAQVIDLRPMLNVRSQYQQALATLNVAKVAERSAGQELSRLKQLSKGTGSVAAKKINYAQATYNEVAAKLEGSRVELQAIKEQALQTWGETLATWIVEKDSKEWQRLLQHNDSLLLVTLAAKDTLAADVSFIRISRDGSRKQARKAYYVSPALQTDNVSQGETYYFKTATGKLRTGMRLDAWIVEASKPFRGVFIPEQAIVWHQGQQWVYVQIDDDLYERRPLIAGQVSVGGVFTQTDLITGDKLVLKGAQMLLSEEFKWQIADEDDD